MPKTTHAKTTYSRRSKGAGTAQEKAEATATLRILARRVDLLAQQHAAALSEREQAIRDANDVGLTYRDIGAILDLSHSRVEQIIHRGTVSPGDKAKTLSPAARAKPR